MDRSSSRMYCFTRRLGKRFCAWEALKFLLGCDGGIESVQTAPVPYLGVRIHTILVALLSKNTPYEASLLLFDAPCHAGVSGHGHCGGNLCGDLCSLRQLRKPIYPTLSGG